MDRWQLTATTFICKLTGTEVTVTVHRDGRLSCTGQVGQHVKGRVGRSPCRAQDCLQIKSYESKLLAEESDG